MMISGASVTPPRHSSIRWPVLAGVLVVIPCLAVAAIVWKAPFRRDTVQQQIGTALESHVEFGTFRTTWFPPGFKAENVQIVPRSAPGPALLTVAHLTVESSFFGLLRPTKQFSQIDIEGMHLVYPLHEEAFGAPKRKASPFLVAKVYLRNAQLDFLSGPHDSEPLRFEVHSVTLQDYGRDNSTHFTVSMSNAAPTGEIRARGTFGPWNSGEIAATPVDGTFTYEKADLKVAKGISGLLDAQGKIHGTFGAMNTDASIDVPAFQVNGSSHSVHVAATAQASVNGTTGDTTLTRVVSHFNNTTIMGSGTVAGTTNRTGKSVHLNVAVAEGRVDDILLLFTNKPKPAMSGNITLKAEATIPPGPPDFLSRLRMGGDFDVQHARFANAETETVVSRLSASAKGESKNEERGHPEAAWGEFRGHISDFSGVAHLEHIHMQAPGITSSVEGTFELHQKLLNLHGELVTAGKLSDTTSGFKSFLLKVVKPLWKKNGAQQTIPYEITGTPSHLKFKLQFHRRAGPNNRQEQDRTGSRSTP